MNSSEPWLEPDPEYRTPGTSWHPRDSPPPLQMLPKIKKHSHKMNLSLFAVSPDLISGRLTSSPVLKLTQTPQVETRSRSFDSDDASRSLDEFPQSNHEWKHQTLIFKQPLTPSDPDNVFKHYTSSPGPGRPPKSQNATPKIIFSSREELESPILDASDPPQPPSVQKQLVIKLKTSYTDRRNRSARKSGHTSMSEDIPSLPDSRESSPVTDDSESSEPEIKVERIRNGKTKSRRSTRIHLESTPSATPKRPRSISPVSVQSTPTRRRGRKPKKAR